MITFNVLLREAKVDPAVVKLARHQDQKGSTRQTPYQLWRAADGRFELYQRIQRELKFRDALFVASFVATPLDETLFVGLYKVAEVGKAPSGLLDPITGENVGGYHFYDLEASRLLQEYVGRLVVEWGPGYRAWVQRAANQDKEIVEIRRMVSEPTFPGFLQFRERLSLLGSVPQAWRQALSAVCGVYLLTCPRTGRQYVGSAGSDGGFWGRWEDYIASGHGGNKRMIDVPAADYFVSILEVASSSAGQSELIRIENRWKEKLSTREFGLNAN